MDASTEIVEQIDELKQNHYKILQRKDGFCYGIDAVLLADFARSGIRKDNKVVDLCTGTGIVPLLLESSTKAANFYGLEIQSISADMAKRSVKLNKLEEKIQIIQGDLKECQSFFNKHFCDVVTCNPPYMLYEQGKKSPSDAKAIARHEVLCNLEEVIKAVDYLVKPNGSLFMVHRPFRLGEIIKTLGKYDFEAKKIRFVQPHENEAPNIVLIHAVKGGGSGVIVEPPLIVRYPNGEYTEEVQKIYASHESRK